MRVNKFIESAITQIMNGIDKANEELNFKAAAYPEEVEFELKIMPGEDGMYIVEPKSEEATYIPSIKFKISTHKYNRKLE